jgi:hypothetical protein
MDMPNVVLKFNNKEESTALPRVPVAGDYINVRGDEFLVSKVVMKTSGLSTVTIDDVLNTDKPKQTAGPRIG